MEYSITWKVQIDGDSPIDAAHNAFLMQQDKESTATCFTVKNETTGETTEIDLQLDSPEFLDALSSNSEEAKAGELLSGYDDGELTLPEMIAAIKEQAKIDDTVMVDCIDGVYTWQNLENRLTCAEFLDQIT